MYQVFEIETQTPGHVYLGFTANMSRILSDVSLRRPRPEFVARYGLERITVIAKTSTESAAKMLRKKLYDRYKAEGKVVGPYMKGAAKTRSVERP